MGLQYKFLFFFSLMALPLLTAQQAMLTANGDFRQQGNNNKVSLIQAIDAVGKMHGVFFSYDVEALEPYYVEKSNWKNSSVDKLLQQWLRSTNLQYQKISERSYIIFKRKPPRHSSVEKKTKRESLASRRIAPMPMLAHRRPAYVQNQFFSVTGSVVDNNGEPLIGVTVQCKEVPNIGTVTDVDGFFQIEVPNSEHTLIFSYVGYKKQEVPLLGRKELEVTLEEEAKALDEVVVVGFSTQKKSDLTGSVLKVNTEDIQEIPVVNAAEALRGRAAGVQVTANSGAPGRAPTIRIRGESSINATNDPLIVIDGAPGGDLASLNLNDIESFEVLKDAAAASIFGKSGANGVILITTKRAKKGTSRFDFNVKYGARQFPQPHELLNGQQFFDYLQEVLDFTPPSFADSYAANYDSVTLSTIDTNNLNNIQWQDEMFDVGSFQEYSLSFSNGAENFSYRLSGSYLQDKGIIRPAEFNRYTFMANVDGTMFDRLKIFGNLFYTLLQSNEVSDSGLGWNGGVVNATLQYPPFLPILDDASGNFFPNPLRPNVDSPSALANGIRRNSSRNRVNGFFKASYELVKGLTLRTEWFGRINYNKSRSFTDRISTYIGRDRNGLGSDDTDFSINTTIQNFIEYQNVFGKHDFYALAGHIANHVQAEGFSVLGFDYPTDNIVLVRNASRFEPPNDYERINRNYGFVSRVNYSYDNKYFVQLNFRADGSPNFARGNKWGFFPSASFGWKLSEEPFLAGIDNLDLLKLRFGLGQTGNDAIGFGYLSTYGSGARSKYPVYGTDEVVATYARGLANPNLKWEETLEYNLGFDLVTHNGRLELNLDLYRRNSFDLLYRQPVPITTGSAAVNANLGEIRNQGVELFLSSFNVNTPDFSWKTSVNFAFNDNEVLSLGNDVEEDRSDVTWITPGYPLNAFFGYRVDRLFQQDDFNDDGTLKEGIPLQAGAAPGDIKFVNFQDNVDLDFDGRPDPVINADDDRVYLGNPLPPITYGMTNSFSYKGLSLTVFLQGVAGNKIYNQTRSFMEGMNDFFNQSITVLDRWTPENTDTDMPRAVITDPNRNARESDRWIEDGSYLRIKDITLSYTLPRPLMDKLSMQRARIFLSGQNWVTFTNYSGYDPEVNFIDNGVYPQVRSLILGIDASF